MKSASRSVSIAAIAAIGGFLFGFDTAVINGTVGALTRQFAAGAFAVGFAVSAALIGCAVGAYAAGDVADRYGRTKTMVFAAALFVVSGVFSGAARGLGELSIWRLVGGVAIGIASVIAPAYIAEIAPAHLRGRLGSLQQLAIVVGIFQALLVDYAIARAAGSALRPVVFGLPAWRFMFWSEVVPAVLYAVGALFLPESPRWLMARGREDDARRVLAELGEDAEAKSREIRASFAGGGSARLSDLRGDVFGLRRVVWVGLALATFQQFVGINVIFYYSSALWQAVGFSETDALAVTVITGATNIVTTLVAIATIDRYGRRPLLVAGSIGMTVSLAAMAAIFAGATVDAGGQLHLGATAGMLALVSANAFVFCFGFSWGPVVWVLLSEMFANRIRAKALAVAAAAQWVANFFVSVTFPALAKVGLGAAYATYAGAALVSLFIVLRWVPETRGKELEEM